MIDFHGWRMPLRYGSIPDEHVKVRLSAGLFDLCHMGRLEIVGRAAAEWVGRLITNDYDAMRPGDARYTLFCNEGGTILDDAIVYRLPQSVFLVVNASNRERIVDWMEAHKSGLDAQLIDRTRDLAMVAIQGPQAVRILPSVVERFDGDWETQKYYSVATAHIHGKAARIARTGYTGEDGFEVYLDAENATDFWTHLLEVGANRVAPVGLGARDTLRLEAGMPLYGNELDLQTDPFEAGLGFAVKLEKASPFIGQESLRARKAAGPPRVLRGFRVLGRRVARSGMKIYPDAGEAVAPAGSGAGEAPEAVGEITSGAPSPTLGYPIAMGYLSRSAPAGQGKERAPQRESPALRVDIRGRMEPIQVETLPFYSRTRKKVK